MLVHFLTSHFSLQVFASGGKTAPVVVHVFENTHILTGLGGGGLNVHVNLRLMHMLRHVTGLGGVNVHSC